MIPPRTFTGTRTVRLGDVDATGRLRLDALARYLQDVATDDATEVGLTDGWVLRRLALTVEAFPRFRDRVELETWCSGIGASAAERRTTLRVGGRVAAEARALWVFVTADGRPARIDARFLEHYGASARGRGVRTRLRHGPVPEDARTHPWPLRAADVDVLGHVNNAVSLAAVEDALAAAGPTDGSGPWSGGNGPWSVEIEYHSAIEPAEEPVLAWVGGPAGELRCWLVCRGQTRVSAHLVRRGQDPGPA